MERIVHEVSFIPSSKSFPKLYKRAAIYCRVSSGKTEQLNSLSAQASAYVQMFAKRFDCQLVDIYIDVCTGETLERREFSRMMGDIEAGKLDLIIAKSISRFGRNTEDSLIAIRKCADYNVQLIFEEEKIDTFKENTEFIISVMAAYAQADNESRRQNQRWAIQRSVEDGTSELYSRRCYGYMKDREGRLVIDNEQAETVQMIYAEYLNGSSIIGLQKMLSANGIVSPSGKEQWSKKSIENILINEKYTGSVIVMKTRTLSGKVHKRVVNTTENKYMIPDFHPAIITKEIFDAVQQERCRRCNTVTDEQGTHRKSRKYSSKRNNAEKKQRIY